MHSQQLKSSNLKQPVCGKRAVVRSSHVTPEQFRRECGRAHSSPTTDVYNDEVSVCVSRFCLFCLPPAKLTIYI